MQVVRILHYGAVIASILFIAGSAYYHFKQPLYDWDMLAYTAIQYKMQGIPDSQIHACVYSQVFNHLDSTTQSFLSSKPLEVRAVNEPDFFLEQLPFYEIKPGYNYAVNLMMKICKVSVITAMQLVSIISFIIVAGFLLYYLQLFYTGWLLLLLTAAVSAIPTLSMAARLFTPDMLSICMLMPVFYLMRNKTPVHEALIYLLLILSVSVRPDNVLLLFIYPLISYMMNSKILFPKTTVSGMLVGVLFYLIIGNYFNGYGWKITFQHSALDLSVTPSYWSAIPLQISEYFRALVNGVLLVKTKVVFTVFITTLTYYSINHLIAQERKEMYQLWLLNLIFFLLKFSLFPVFDDRYYLQSILLAALLIIRAIIPPNKLLHT